jgi:AcrR family transcriptional regulator
MPTSTFLNLPDEKRQFLTDLALEEFANNDFKNASVSKIVSRAGIAKGSLYQYFIDKQDLYFYLIGLASQKKQEFLTGILDAAPQAPVFERLHDLFMAMLGFQREYPLLAKLGSRILNTNSPLSKDLLEKARVASQQQFSDLFAQGQAAGEIRAEVDTAAAGFILSAVILEAGNQPGLTLEDFERVYEQLVSILKNGMAQPGRKNGEN